jgi:hypothetical protein
MDAKDENLRELIEKFIDAKKAGMYLEDIEAGERILREHPAPEPDDMVLANIKANMMLHKVPQRTVTFRKKIFEALAVAASIVIIAGISLRSINLTEAPKGPPNTGSLLPAGWWTLEDRGYAKVLNDYRNINTELTQLEEEDYNDDALVMDEFEHQIEQVKNHLENVDTPIYTAMEDYGSPSILEEIENQLNELNGSFWQDDYSNAGAYE